MAFLAKIEKIYDGGIRVEKYSGRPCESVGGSSDPIGIPIGQKWQDKAILGVRLAIENVLGL